MKHTEITNSQDASDGGSEHISNVVQGTSGVSNIASRDAIQHVFDLNERQSEIAKLIQAGDFEALSTLFCESIAAVEQDDTEQNSGEQWGLPTADAKRCLLDTERTTLFKQAIESVVQPGDVVLGTNVHPGDVVLEAGAGTGVLALIAAARGAKKVYAVEINPNTVKVCKQFIKHCGFEDRIEVIQGDATTFTPPEQVDVIMSENMYTGLLEEPQQQVMNNLLMHLKPGGRVVPKKIESFVELVAAPESNTQSVVRRELPQDVQIASTTTKYDDVRFDTQEPLGLDTHVMITATEDATVNAVNISSLIHLTDDVCIERNSCDFLGNDEVVYLKEPITVRKGQQYSVHICYNGGDKASEAIIEVEPVEADVGADEEAFREAA